MSTSQPERCQKVFRWESQRCKTDVHSTTVSIFFGAARKLQSLLNPLLPPLSWEMRIVIIRSRFHDYQNLRLNGIAKSLRGPFPLHFWFSAPYTATFVNAVYENKWSIVDANVTYTRAREWASPFLRAHIKVKREKQKALIKHHVQIVCRKTSRTT